MLLGLAGSREREAIRPHVLGNFSDMLLAVESHPAAVSLWMELYSQRAGPQKALSGLVRT